MEGYREYRRLSRARPSSDGRFLCLTSDGKGFDGTVTGPDGEHGFLIAGRAPVC